MIGHPSYTVVLDRVLSLLVRLQWRGLRVCCGSVQSRDLGGAELFPQPEDYAKIGDDQLRADGSYYRLQAAQEYDEISYLDEVRLMTIDHSPGVDVFLSLLKVDVGRVYTVN
jgi:hypothetical protein